MSQLPRGWTLRSGVNAGLTPLIAIPAVPGVNHIITSITSSLLAANVNAGATVMTIETGTGISLFFAGMPASAFGTVGEETMSGENVVQSGVGGAINITWNSSVAANWNGQLIVQGYDL